MEPAVGQAQIREVIVKRQLIHVSGEELDLAEPTSGGSTLGPGQHLLGQIGSDIAHLLIRTKCAKSERRCPSL